MHKDSSLAALHTVSALEGNPVRAESETHTHREGEREKEKERKSFN